MTEAVEPHLFAFPDTALDDLRGRLSRTCRPATDDAGTADEQDGF